MSLPTIVVVGSLNTDLVTNTPRVPDAGETIHANSFSTFAGGKGANQAVACARLSRQKTANGIITAPSTYIRMVGCVGDDEFGNVLKNGLKADGIDVEGVQVKSGSTTGVAVILVESSGENRILITAGANALCEPSASYLSGSPPPALLVMQLEVPEKTVLQMLQVASEAVPPVPTLLNPAPANKLPDEAYPKITHLILNETEAAILCDGRAVRTESDVELVEDCRNLAGIFVEKGIKGSIVITLGARGAFWYDVKAEKSDITSGEKVEVVDTTAAGDTFVGAFAVKIVHGYDVSEAVEYAIRASARTVTKLGAQSSIPWREEVS